MSGCAPSWATPRSPERLTYGPAIGAVSALLGQPFMPWQQAAADVSFEILPSERWAYPTVLWTTPRQAGKTTGLRAVNAHRGQILAGGSLWMTAQKRDKARQRWLDLTEPLVTKMPARFRRNVGVSHEVLRWVETLSRLIPFAPNKDDMHGESPDLVSVDEIWAFLAAQAEELQQAYLPGMITKNAQELLTSTQGTDESEWLNELTGTGRALVEEQELDPSKRAGMCYVEYSIASRRAERPDEVEVGGELVSVLTLDDETLLDLIVEHHPAAGHTISREGLAAHLTRFRNNRPGFIRGYGNLRLGSSRPRVIPLGVWSAAGQAPAMPERVGLGVAVDEDGQNVAVVAAGRLESGRAVVEVVQVGDGWTLEMDGAQVEPPEFVKRLRARSKVVGVATMTTGANRDLGDQLDDSLAVGPADCAAACARFRSGVRELTVLHRDQPSLNEAMKTAGQRKAGGGLVWSGEGASVANAASLALWAADHPEEQVPDEFRIF